METISALLDIVREYTDHRSKSTTTVMRNIDFLFIAPRRNWILEAIG